MSWLKKIIQCSCLSWQRGGAYLNSWFSTREPFFSTHGTEMYVAWKTSTWSRALNICQRAEWRRRSHHKSCFYRCLLGLHLKLLSSSESLNFTQTSSSCHHNDHVGKMASLLIDLSWRWRNSRRWHLTVIDCTSGELLPVAAIKPGAISYFYFFIYFLHVLGCNKHRKWMGVIFWIVLQR